MPPFDLGEAHPAVIGLARATRPTPGRTGPMLFRASVGKPLRAAFDPLNVAPPLPETPLSKHKLVYLAPALSRSTKPNELNGKLILLSLINLHKNGYEK